jgi:mono/diheme cytochrome c family protein
MHRTLVALLLLLAACRSGPGAGSAGAPPASPIAASTPGASPADAVQGSRLYARYCASCHGEGARGDGPVAAVLVKPPADLTLLAARHGSPLPREEIADLIDGRGAVAEHGPREMPVWGERLYAGESEGSSAVHGPTALAVESARRGAMLQILDYLELLQRPAPPGSPPE